MPESVHSDVGINSWEPLSELVIVTRLAIGAPSLSHEISGHGEACRQLESDYITLFLTFTTIVLKHKKWLTSNWMYRRSVLPFLTTSKVFMLRSLNFGLTVTIQRLHIYTFTHSLYNLAKTICSFQFSIFTPIVYNVLEKRQSPVFEVNAPPAAFLTSIWKSSHQEGAWLWCICQSPKVLRHLRNWWQWPSPSKGPLPLDQARCMKFE